MGTSVNSLLAKLLAAHKGEPDKVPKGHKTREQWATEWGVKGGKALILIRKGLEKNLMGKAMHRVQAGKRLRPTEHYFEL